MQRVIDFICSLRCIAHSVYAHLFGWGVLEFNPCNRTKYNFQTIFA